MSMITLLSKSMPLSCFKKARARVLARLLAIAHAAQVGVLLDLDSQRRGVALGSRQTVAALLPPKPQLLRLRL